MSLKELLEEAEEEDAGIKWEKKKIEKKTSDLQKISS